MLVGAFYFTGVLQVRRVSYAFCTGSIRLPSSCRFRALGLGLKGFRLGSHCRRQ